MPRRHHDLITITATAALLAAVACHDSTGPKNGGPPPTHPTGVLGARISGLAGRPFGLRVARAGDLIVTEQDQNAIVQLDSTGATRTPTLVGADPGDAVVNRAGTLAMASSFFNGTVSFVNLATHQAVATVAVAGNTYRLALSSDESRLFVSSTNGNLYVVNTTSRVVAGSPVTLGGSLQGLALSPDGKSLYVTSSSGGVWRLDAGSLATLRSANLGCAAQDVALSTDGAEAYVACENGSVQVLDAATLAPKQQITDGGWTPFGLAVSPDNARLYVSSALAGKVTIIDRATRAVLDSLDVGGTPRRVAFNARGTRAYVANEGDWIDVIQ